MYAEIVKEFEQAVLNLDRLKVKSILVQKSKTTTLLESLEKILVPAMENIGKRWENGDLALSQVYMGGKICEEVVDELFPQNFEKRADDPNLGLLVYKDHHILGKRIVYSFLKASGYDVIDYGSLHEIDEIIEKIKNDKIDILLISVLMLNSALNIKELTDKLKEEKMDVKVIVGGAPFRFDKNLYKEIGADSYAINASKVVDTIKSLKSIS